MNTDLIAQLRKDARHHIDGQMAGLMEDAANALRALQTTYDEAHAELLAIHAVMHNSSGNWSEVEGETRTVGRVKWIVREWAAEHARAEALLAEVAKLRDQAVHWEMVWATADSNHKAALARLAELEKKEPEITAKWSWYDDNSGYFQTGTIRPPYGGMQDGQEVALFAAAGASPVEPALQVKVNLCEQCGKVLPNTGTYGHSCNPVYRPAQPSQALELSEQEVMHCIAESGCYGTVKMSYESGPYSVDTPSLNATKFTRAIIAAINAKGVQPQLQQSDYITRTKAICQAIIDDKQLQKAYYNHGETTWHNCTWIEACQIMARLESGLRVKPDGEPKS